MYALQQEGEKVFKDAPRVFLDEEALKPNLDCGYCVRARGVRERNKWTKKNF